MEGSSLALLGPSLRPEGYSVLFAVFGRRPSSMPPPLGPLGKLSWAYLFPKGLGSLGFGR